MKLHLVYGIAPSVDWNKQPFIAAGWSPADIVEHHWTDSYSVDPRDVIVSHSLGFKTAKDKRCTLLVAIDPVKGIWPFGSVQPVSPCIVYRSGWLLLTGVKNAVEQNKINIFHANQPREMPATVAARIRKFLETES